MSKCGKIFNRHKWKDETEMHRICLKCGETQYYQHGAFAEGYYTVGFNAWKKMVDKRRQWLQEEEADRSKALEYTRPIK